MGAAGYVTQIIAPLSNYYGYLELTLSSEGDYYLELDDYDKPKRVRVSVEFARAFEKEFTKKEKIDDG